MCKKSLKIHDTRKCFLLVMSILFEKKTSHEGTTQHREIKPFQKTSEILFSELTGDDKC